MKNNGLVGLTLLLLLLLAFSFLVRSIKSEPHALPAAFAIPTTLAEATAKSTEDGRPVLAFATADWCGPCQTLKGGTLTDPAITDMLVSRSHPVLIDLTGDNPDAESLKIFSIPAMIVLKEGKEVARIEGVVSVEELRGWFEAALAKQ
jgi:thioredoxin 2